MIFFLYNFYDGYDIMAVMQNIIVALYNKVPPFNSS